MSLGRALDERAPNYNADATIDDGSCIEPIYTCPDKTVICDSNECPPGNSTEMVVWIPLVEELFFLHSQKMTDFSLNARSIGAIIL